MSAPLDHLLLNQKIVVCVGPGGVGKTTTSAALAVRAAQAGRRVLVLTVDPSRRLASSMGIDLQSVQPTRVAGQAYSGELFAAVVHAAEVLDGFVKRYSADSAQAERLMKNRLYRQLRDRLSGSQEFTALEQLLQFAEQESYDLVVLDTPPAQHARDFLRAPLKLHALFQSSVTKWFLQPSSPRTGWMKTLWSSGTEKVLAALDQLTGREFIAELREFFQLAQAWQGQLSEHMVRVHRLLNGAQASFVLITSFDEAKLSEAVELHRDLKREGYTLSAVVVNRAAPLWLERDSGLNPEQSLWPLYQQMVSYYQQRESILTNYRAKMARGVLCYKVPEFLQDIHDLAGVERVAQELYAEDDVSDAL